MPEFYSNGRVVPAGNGWKWIADAWTLFRRSPGVWIGITVIVLVMLAVLGYLRLPGVLASMLLTPVFSGGLMAGCKALDEGQPLKVLHLFTGFRERFGALAMVGVFYFVANLVITLIGRLIVGDEAWGALAAGADPVEVVMKFGSALMLGLLVMLALMLPVAMAAWFAPGLIMLRHLGVAQALKSSFAGCLRNFLPFLVYGAILLALSIVGAVVLAILPSTLGYGVLALAWLVIGPVTFASIYTAWKDIYFS